MTIWTRRTYVSVLIALIGFAIAQTPAVAWDGPPGFQILCLTKPAECKGGGATRVVATEELMATVQAVNKRVNRSIRSKPDGRVDVWSVGVSAGDCEDYALTKRRRLIHQGVPASSLRIAYVKTKSGLDHAVLILITDEGKFVLDNLSSAVIPLSQSRYKVLSMQTANPKQWT